MIQVIGIIELALFYIGYFLKFYEQKMRGIKTNQLGIGNKSNQTIQTEKLLRLSSTTMALAILVSTLLNTSLFHSTIVRSIGLILLGLGTSLFTLAMITMKDSWRAGISDKDKTEIVTQGIYKISRNPAFLGFDLTYIGACFAFGNILLILMATFTIVMMHLQILEEEKFLELTFGDKYITYKNNVGRYLMFI